MKKAVLCHHRCASTWFWDHVMFRLAMRAGERTASVNSSWRDFNEKALVEVFRSASCIGDANASSATVRALERHAGSYRAVHLVRDPRDLLISAYFSHRYSHTTKGWPELIGHRKTLQGISMEDGLILEMDFTRFAFDALSTWETRPTILEMKFERVTADPEKHIMDVVHWFDWPFNNGQVQKLVASASYERLAGRHRGVVDVKHHYRRGTPHDWVNYFTDRVRSEFRDRYGQLLVQWGYERPDSWWAAAGQPPTPAVRASMQPSPHP